MVTLAIDLRLTLPQGSTILLALVSSSSTLWRVVFISFAMFLLGELLQLSANDSCTYWVFDLRQMYYS